jgi:hypothetical protein
MKQVERDLGYENLPYAEFFCGALGNFYRRWQCTDFLKRCLAAHV